MPVYDLRNNETGEEWEQSMSYDDMKTLTADGNVVILYKKVNFVHSAGSDGGGKVPDHFKEVMSRVAEQNPNTPIAEKYGSKTIKDVKIRDAVDKARKKAGGSLMTP
jgi:hypothetical protein